MYDLSVDGVRDFSRYTNLLGQRKISRDSLSGLVDGANATYHTQSAPILSSGSLTIHDGSGSVVLVSSVDYDTGEIVMPSPPDYQPTATYTYTPYTTGQIKSFLMAGFDEMQGRWPRAEWYLSSSTSALTNPTDDDSHIYVVLRSAPTGELTDPSCSGSIAFSLLRSQIRFYMACCEYAYASRQLQFSAETGIAFRETRGAAVDRQAIAKNIDLSLERIEKRLITAMIRAQEEYYAGGNLGAYVPPYHTKDYLENYEWQSDT